jgi:MerR family mercuric resistance operon transcriptional regulator
MVIMVAKIAVDSQTKIGEVAKETGLTVDTIRFYEKQGLLKRSNRTEGGFRLFGPQQIEALKFIRKAQYLGFSLQEVRELLGLQRDGVEACEGVRELVSQKLASVRGKIEELRKLEGSLAGALRTCNRSLRKISPAEDECPVLEELGRTNGQRGIDL